MLSPFSKLISVLLGILLFQFLILLNNSKANDLTITVTTSAGGTLNTLQDGQNNDIDFDIQSMNGFIIDLDQVGNNNNIDIDVDGRNSNGSSMYINQSGNNKNFTGSYWCGHAYCTMTVNQ